MLAKDVMSSPVHTVPPTASLDTAAAVMTKHSVTALAVVDGAGRPVGASTGNGGGELTAPPR